MHRFSALLLFLLTTVAISADPVTVVTWNVKEMFSRGENPERFNDIQRMMDHIQPDLILLQEITSTDVVVAMKQNLGLEDWSHAVTDFGNRINNDGTTFAFEVATLSRMPITQAIEYDPFPDEQSDSSVPEVSLIPDLKIGIKPVNTSRGFLWVHIPDWKLTVVNTHLKSSVGRVGERDASNAEKREIVAAQIAHSVSDDLHLFAGQGYAHIVAGDLNVGHSDPLKVGTDLFHDCFEECDTLDGYDETHALLGAGLVRGLNMINLSGHIMTSTFPTYPGTPIDNIYVVGETAGDFSPAQKPADDETFGSDHTPVWTIVQRN